MTKKTKRIYLSPPLMTGKERKYIDEAFQKNWIAPLGPNVDAFENELANYCGVNAAAVLTSGTAALHLALILAGVGPGDIVLCQSFTFAATVFPVLYQGAIPVLIDSEQDTWNMDPELLEQAINDAMNGELEIIPDPTKEKKTRLAARKPKAIIPVHLYGMPCKMDSIQRISKTYDIPVIEDAAEALGSSFKQKKCGSHGTMGILSFNGNKIITSSGGGALLSDNPELIEKSRFLATQSREPAPYYQHEEVGYNYRMSNVVAGIGRGQLEIIEERVRQRRLTFEFYSQGLSENKGISFLKEPEELNSSSSTFFSNRWLTTILIDKQITGSTPEDIRLLLEQENIESRPLWKPMHLQPVFQAYPRYSSGISEKLFNSGLCLPSGSAEDKIIDKIIQIINKATMTK